MGDADPSPEPCFDAWLETGAGEVPAGPAAHRAGALLAGPRAAEWCDALERSAPDGCWRCAVALTGGPAAPLPPLPPATAVLHVALPPDALLASLREPFAWAPLCEAARAARALVRLPLPPGTAAASLARQLVRLHPGTGFLFDPFVHGPAPGWQAQVRLAEFHRVMLSGLGLHPFPAPRAAGWSDRAARHALEFVVGEVGAAHLLYASGAAWHDDPAPEAVLRAWWTAGPEFDAAELRLVLRDNARRVFAGRQREDAAVSGEA